MYVCLFKLRLHLIYSSVSSPLSLSLDNLRSLMLLMSVFCFLYLLLLPPLSFAVIKNVVETSGRKWRHVNTHVYSHKAYKANNKQKNNMRLTLKLHNNSALLTQ